MMNSAFIQLLTFRKIPRHIVAATAIASLVLSVGMVVQGQPPYMIALYFLLPWIPVMMFESLWKIQHYHWIAIFAVITLLQLGHLTEHAVQVGTLMFTNGDIVCPPPVDNDANAARAIAAGLRAPDQAATGISSSLMIRPDADGLPRIDASGAYVSGPPACGIFGQLDLEIVHLVWEIAGWLMLLLLLVQFPRNRWLWVALGWATFHTFEHLFICYTFFLDHPYAYAGTRQLWGTVVSGNMVTAYPVGVEPTVLNFYDVAGKFGLLAKNGLIGSLFPAINPYLPTRPYLHLYYNAIVTITGLIAFVQEARYMHDRYARWALPTLREAEVAMLTGALRYLQFQRGEVIADERTGADCFFIVTRGRVIVARDGQSVILKAGEYFGGPIMLADPEQRPIVRAAGYVEVIRLDEATFARVMRRSRKDRQRVETELRRRLGSLVITNGGQHAHA